MDNIEEAKITISDVRKEFIHKIYWKDVLYPATYDLNIDCWNNAKYISHSGYSYVEIIAETNKTDNNLFFEQGTAFTFQLSMNSLGYMLERMIHFKGYGNDRVRLVFTRSGKGRVSISVLEKIK